MNTSERPSVPFAISLIAGVIILLGGITTTIWASSGMPGWGSMMGSMMGGYQGIMGGMGFGSGMFFGMSIIGVVSGLLVLVGAMMLYNRPRDASTWGLVVLVFSVLSLLGMGGFFIGTVLGIVGGLLALIWKPAVVPVQGSVPSAQ
jgi:hypothetical protein